MVYITGQVPYLAYILTTGYLVTFVMSSILVKGISQVCKLALNYNKYIA
jgi:hypothetical protein